MLRGLRMPSIPHSSMCMAIGWNGLSMAMEGCSVYMPIIITNFRILKLVTIMSMYTEHPSVAMLSQFQPIGMFIEL